MTDARAAASALTSRGLALLGEPFPVATGWTVEIADPNVLGFTDTRPCLSAVGPPPLPPEGYVRPAGVAIVHDLIDWFRQMRHSDPLSLQSSPTMSKTSAPVRSTRERVAISVVIGVLTFVLVNMTTENDQGLGAGVVVTIIVWLLTAPKNKNSEEKK